MKYSIHMAVILLLALSSWTRGENQMVVRMPNSQLKFVFQLYSEINTNTALVFPGQIIERGNKTVKIMTDKPMDRSSVIRLIEDELDKQAGIKIRHVSLEEAMALDTIDMGRKETVLVVSVPPPPKQSLAGTSNEVRSISFTNAPLEEVRKFYESVSGTRVIYSDLLNQQKVYAKLTLNVAGPMTKDTAHKFLDLTLAMQDGIKVRQEQPGQTVWSRDMLCRAPKEK